MESEIWNFVRRAAFPECEPGWQLATLTRPFLWSEEQIMKLFDSIMRGYPIGTFLIWHTEAGVVRQRFVDHWPSTASDDALRPSIDTKNIVLDGHQRIQSLVLGLAGSYNGRELYFDVLSGETIAPDGIRYRFGFKDADVGWPWVRFKTMLGEVSLHAPCPIPVLDNILATAPDAPADTEHDRAILNQARAIHKFIIEYAISCQFLGGGRDRRVCKEMETYTADDAVEIFNRTNAGCTAADRFVAPLT